MGNGIQKKVYYIFKSLQKNFENENNVRINQSKSEIIVEYDKVQNFSIENKDKTDQKKYPSNFKGKIIARPFNDMKYIMFKYNGNVFTRFYFKNSNKYSDKKIIGKIIDNDLIPAEYNENNTNKLIKTPPPPRTNKDNNINRKFKGRKVDFEANNAQHKKIGLAGEKFILEYEKNYLIANGRKDLAEKVIHTSEIEGDGTGYDIKSYTITGEDKFIEVKTTTGGENTAFDITINEVLFSKEYPDNYYLYRVYNFDKETKQGQFYQAPGKIKDKFHLESTKFKANR